MSIHDSAEKINPVKGRELNGARDPIQQRPSAFNGVKLFIESEKGKDILIVLIVILVGIGSFELGRLSKSDRSGGIKIEYTDPSALESLGGVSETANALSSVAPDENKVKGGYFASSRGTKYYPADCTAGQSIKESNKVWFETRDKAERADYELSSSCR